MFHTHLFDNGLTLLAESMDWAESSAFALLIPCGVNDDPAEKIGLAEMLCDMSLRGAGARDNRSWLHALENLGCERSESVGTMHTTYCGATLASNLLPSLALIADAVRRPHFPAEQLEDARQIASNEIQAVQDDPARRMMLELERNFYPDPWGRASIGTEESIQRITLDDIRRQHRKYFQPRGTILSVAGRFDWESLLRTAEELFADWPPKTRPALREKNVGSRYVHLPFEGNQTHIGVAFPTVPFTHPDYLKAWSTVGILSGGMSSRLFDEIREKRGLCYSVGASYTALPQRGAVFVYCGTGAERAQESLDLLLFELRRMADGIDENELERLKIRAKSTLVMQGESTSARCVALARDWFYLGRLREMKEIETAIERLSCEEIDAFLHASPFGPFHVATLGPRALVAGSD